MSFRALLDSIEANDLETVKCLCSSVEVDPSAQDNDAIISAARRGHLEVVKYMCWLDRVDICARNNLAAYWAAENGHFEAAKHLGSMTSAMVKAFDMLNEVVQSGMLINNN